MNDSKFYTDRAEKANYLTHAFGVIIAFISAYILVSRAIEADNGWAVLAHTIFCFGILLCMLSSTIYHYAQKPKTKKILRKFDHASIYILIAASYSPFSLILLRKEGLWGWSLFVAVWLIAIIGVGVNFLFPIQKNSNLKTTSYVLMGLAILIAIKPSIRLATANNCMPVLFWLVAGGVFYIIGAVIYALAKKEFSHTVFHIFVLLGLISHIISAYLIPV